MKSKRKQKEKRRKERIGTYAKTASPHEDAVSSKLTLTYISTIHQNYYKPKSQLKRMSSKTYNTLIQAEPARCYHPHHRREEPPLRCEARLYHLMAHSRDGTDTTVPCTHRYCDGLSNLLPVPG